MNEVEFLNKILDELEDAEYGEGLLFNISCIDMLIKKRIKELKTKSEQDETDSSRMVNE